MKTSNFFVCAVLSHQYGQDGRNLKKIKNKAIALDFKVFSNLAGQNLLSHLNSSISQFVESLNKTSGTGNFFIFKNI